MVETSTSASSERFDYALAPSEVLARDLTVCADDRTVRIYSPDSRLHRRNWSFLTRWEATLQNEASDAEGSTASSGGSP